MLFLQLTSTKNCEGCKIFALIAGSQGFLPQYCGWWQKIWSSRVSQKTFFTHCTASSMNINTFLSGPLAPKSHGKTSDGPAWMPAQTVGCIITREKLRTSGTQILKCLPSPPEGDIIFIRLCSKHACLLIQRKTLSLFSKAVHFTNMLRNFSQTKANQMFAKCAKI